jgi:hypothetical protein
MSKYIIRPDEENQYPAGQQLYHLFEKGMVNILGEPYCHLSFSTYKDCVLKRQELERKDLAEKHRQEREMLDAEENV